MVQQRRRPAGVLHGAPPLLCLALLILAIEVAARAAPSDNDHGDNSDVVNQPNQDVVDAQEVSLDENSALVFGDLNEDDLRECMSDADSTLESCGVDPRMLVDYSPPSASVDPHPGGPLP